MIRVTISTALGSAVQVKLDDSGYTPEAIADLVRRIVDQAMRMESEVLEEEA